MLLMIFQFELVEHLLHPSVSFPTVIEAIRRLYLSQILQFLLPYVALEAFEVRTLARVRRAIHSRQFVSTFLFWRSRLPHHIEIVVLGVITASEEFLITSVLLNRLDDVGFLGLRAEVPLVRKLVDRFVYYMWLEEAKIGEVHFQLLTRVRQPITLFKIGALLVNLCLVDR